MSKAHISLFANVSKSQIKETETHFNIEGVPITVDDAVMNGIHYSAEHNREGMPTIRDRVVTLTHPTTKNGSGADAYAGESLQKFYSGGHIETVYADNGVWKVNISIDKEILRAQDRKQDSNFYDRLANKEAVGVSTGLYTEVEAVTGKNSKGIEYRGVATKQQYNHLAMLDANEPPAGGQDTFMRFNANGNENIVLNLADYMPDSTPQDSPVEVEVEIEQKDEFNSILAKLLALIGVTKMAGNKEETTPQTEVNAMSIKEKMQALKDKGMYKDNMTDEEVSNAYETMMKQDNAQASNSNDDGNAQDSVLLEAINKLSEKVDSLEGKLTAQENSKKDALVNELKDLDTGLSENALKALAFEDLESLHNKVVGQTFSLNGAFRQSQNRADDYSDSFIDVEVE